MVLLNQNSESNTGRNLKFLCLNLKFLMNGGGGGGGGVYLLYKSIPPTPLFRTLKNLLTLYINS